ncbi:hypothetical protein SPI_02271 [Niveomyces insectorum RCEF 264]|uniref:Uncharacterized protein n=1 Tax=Niveomyces insectorum RCEF 264 TaxID=1081102 RepID=A0A167XW59_9HYPO|nr:hypothetical protein SPI_02271 [Niveomyces insectorum RCEF 264]
MVLAVLLAFGAVVGASEGIQASQRRARREEHRSRKNNLTVHCPKSSAYAPLLEGRQVVLSGGRLYVDTGNSPDPDAPFGHPFAGYYLPYPDARHAGLVSTITDVAPIMNWVYVDRTTHELCYGGRAASADQVTGPWDCTRQDRRLTLCGWEGFVAVRLPMSTGHGNGHGDDDGGGGGGGSGGGFWSLFFDLDADRLRGLLARFPAGTVAVEVELARRELRTPAPLHSVPVNDNNDAEKTTEPENEWTAEQVAVFQKKRLKEEAAQRRTQASRAQKEENSSQDDRQKGSDGVDNPSPVTTSADGHEAEWLAGRDVRDGDDAGSRSMRSTKSTESSIKTTATTSSTSRGTSSTRSSVTDGEDAPYGGGGGNGGDGDNEGYSSSISSSCSDSLSEVEEQRHIIN